MRLTDEVDDVGTPAEDLRIYEYGFLSELGQIGPLGVHTQASTMVISSH